MSQEVNYICPICSATNLVEINECLIRDTDKVLCENESYKHLQRGHIHLFVHTQENRMAEKEENELSMQLALN